MLSLFALIVYCLSCFKHGNTQWLLMASAGIFAVLAIAESLDRARRDANKRADVETKRSNWR